MRSTSPSPSTCVAAPAQPTSGPRSAWRRKACRSRTALALVRARSICSGRIEVKTTTCSRARVTARALREVHRLAPAPPRAAADPGARCEGYDDLPLLGAYNAGVAGVPKSVALGDIDALVPAGAGEEARNLFRQGLALRFGFNVDEARRNFVAAAETAADAHGVGCAVCLWGIARSLMPDVNNYKTRRPARDGLRARQQRAMGGAMDLRLAPLRRTASGARSRKPSAKRVHRSCSTGGCSAAARPQRRSPAVARRRSSLACSPVAAASSSSCSRRARSGCSGCGLRDEQQAQSPAMEVDAGEAGLNAMRRALAEVCGRTKTSSAACAANTARDFGYARSAGLARKSWSSRRASRPACRTWT